MGIDISPDMITYTKGIGGGFPLGALVLSSAFKKRFNPSEEHTTFSSTPVGMVTSLAALEVMKRLRIGENCEKMGNIITKGLKDLQEGIDFIGDIRGPGLFIGIELVKSKESRIPFNELCEEIVKIAPNHGIYFGKSTPVTNPKGKKIRQNVLMIKPPLNINEEESRYIIQEVEEVLKQALKNLK